jgi:hypothetical protein
MDMDPERMKKLSEAVTRAKDAFGNGWIKLKPKERLFYIRTALEFIEENGEEAEIDRLKLLELTEKELEQVKELEERAKLMAMMFVSETKTLEAEATV